MIINNFIQNSSANPSKVATNNLRYLMYDVKCLKDGQRNFLKNLDAKGAINIFKDHANSINVFVECTRAPQVQKMLRDREIHYELIGNEAGVRRSSNITGIHLTLPSSPKHFDFPKFLGFIRDKACTDQLLVFFAERIMDWKDFYPLDIINQWMYELEKLYPATCTVSAIGESVEGRALLMLKISNSDATNTGVWLDGGIHAREWITISVVTYIADYIASNFGNLPKTITNKDWYIMPVVNPDGYHYTHTTDRLWRKSRARIGNTVCGVDLNRNFGCNWGNNSIDANITLSQDPSNINYRGSEPFSEPETAAIKDVILYSGLPFKIFMSFHAFTEIVSFPWCYTSEPCPDYVSLLEGGAVIAKAMFNATGKMYRVGNFKDIMYHASGTSIDWSYGVARIPFSYLIELRSKEHRFHLPKDQISDCCKEALSGVLALADFVDTRKCLNCIDTVVGNK